MATRTTLLVLGNGFDLDLGFRTGYQHYHDNQNTRGNGAFPFVRGGQDYHSLGQFILKAVEIQKWYDLENVLAEYGKQYPKVEDIDGDKEDYASLVKSLTLYLKSVDYSHPREASVAARVLKALTECIIPPVVYTFNYTDLSKTCQSLNLTAIHPTYIHGSLKNDDIILGVGDYAKLTSSTDYLYKTSNDQYHSTNLFEELDSCENILLFGISLSQVDYPYFQDFFTRVARGDYVGDRKKYIRVFTNDDKTRLETLRNLRQMNEGMIALTNYSDFDIIRTKGDVDEAKVSAMIEKISSEWESNVR